MKKNMCVEETYLVCGCEYAIEQSDCEFNVQGCLGQFGLKCISEKARLSALAKKVME